MLSTKKLLYKLVSALSVTHVDWTPTRGSSYAGYGGCWYERSGRMIHVHVGVSGLTANTTQTVYTMPAGLRPTATLISQGRSGNSDSFAFMSLASSGTLQIYPQGSYATGEFFYFV